MGLDMCLYEGEKEIAYWRKHPNLHGYIVQNFADGVDECQKIRLNKDDVEKILNAVVSNSLPVTTGFFFGVSTDYHYEYTAKIFSDLLERMKDNPKLEITYQASW